MLVTPVFLGAVKVARQLDQVVLDVALDDRLEAGWGEEDAGPGLESSDILLDRRAIGHKCRQALNDLGDLLDASHPLVLPQVLEGLVGTGSLGLAIAKAGLNLGEMLLLDDAMDDTGEHGVVLIGCQITDWLGIDNIHGV